MAEILYYAGLDLQGNKVLNLGTPTADADAATKLYVDDAVSGITGQLSYQGTIDASTYTNEFNDKNAGDYWVVSASGTILTVSVDPGDIILLNSNTTTATAADFNKIDNNDLTAEQVKALFSAGAGLTYSDGVFSITAGGVGTTQLALDSVDKTIIAADVAGTGLAQNVDGSLEVDVDDTTIQVGASGIEVMDDSITQAKLHADLEAKIVTSVQTTLGDGALTTLPYTHGLGTQYIDVTTYKVSTGEEVKCYVEKTSDNAISIGAFPAPGLNDLLVIVTKKVMS